MNKLPRPTLILLEIIFFVHVLGVLVLSVGEFWHIVCISHLDGLLHGLWNVLINLLT